MVATVPPRRIQLPKRKVKLFNAKGEFIEIDQVVVEEQKRFGAVDELMHPKQVHCPRCGAVPETTNRHSAEGTRVWRCRGCRIFFAQRLPKDIALALCSAAEVKWIRGEDGAPPVPGAIPAPEGSWRIITRADCKACPFWGFTFAKGVKCPNFMGRIGVDWKPEQWTEG